ncbi:hypothetical protein TL16_g09525 [Triparma laevis f. inornata]|uniref:TRAF-type domain-containing protein n=1 Tax=Triparma laevis f. inornata TaxID=1714386 RepID=A0A9W7BB57_9STRA|nr:hypothetical protein TL16_g09525 [Triparma laevis f. inornata]
MANYTAYAWGFNIFGQCGVEDENASYSDTSQSSPNNVLTPTSLLFDSGEDEDGSLMSAYTNTKADEPRKSRKETAWELWSSRGEGGGFVYAGSYMVYGKQDDEALPKTSKIDNDCSLTDVQASPFHSLFLTPTGQVWSTGWNKKGQLGLGPSHSSNGFVAKPKIISFPGSISNVVVSSIAVGAYHSIVSTKSGSVYTWGDGSEGQLGYSEFDCLADDTTGNRRHTVSQFTFAKSLKSNFFNCQPKQVDEFFDAKQVYAGFSYSIVVDGRGKAMAFGFNGEGQLGVGRGGWDSEKGGIRNVKLGKIGQVVEVACGDHHTLYLNKEGKVYATGQASYGRLGLGRDSAADVFEPQEIDLDIVGIHAVKVRAGGASSGLVSADGGLWCWGHNENGNLGLGHQSSVFSPTKLRTFIKVVDASFGEEHGALVCDQNMIWSFGKNNCGRLGVVDAVCDDAEGIVEAEGREGGMASGSGVLDATPIICSAFAIPIGSGNNENDGFNEAMREVVADSPLLCSPCCIGQIAEGEQNVSGVTCGGAHTFAYIKFEKMQPTLLLFPCENEQFGCKARLLRGRMAKHAKCCKYAVKKCPYTSFGCDKFELSEAEATTHVEVCRFRLTKCQHCGSEVSMALYNSHVDIFCTEVLENCAACGQGVPRRELEAHEESCGAMKVSCTKCKLMIPRGEMAEHLKDFCSRRIVECGECGEKITFDMMGSHLKKCQGKNKEEVEEEEEKEEEDEEEEEKVEEVVKKAPLSPKKKKLVKKSEPKRVGGGFNINKKN